MIGALARAARAMQQDEWIAAAQQAVDFLHGALWRDGRLLATYKDGRAHLNAYLDDHAFLLGALTEMMQSAYRPQDLSWALEIAEAMLERFEDRTGGGFFFTSHDHEALIHRPKPGHDNATPSGNGVAARALFILGHWLGQTRYIDAAERTLRAFARELETRPSGFATMLTALDESGEPPTTVILSGDRATCTTWQYAVERRYRPRVTLLDLAGQTSLPAALNKPHPGTPSEASAWICRGATCLPPVATIDALERGLERLT